MLLSLKGINVNYGKAEVVKNVSLEVGEGTITGLIGANGAGKSTILRAISGLIHIGTGEIWFNNQRIDGIANHAIVRRGLIQVPEGRKLFRYMSVSENIKMGAYLRRDTEGIRSDLEKVWQRFPILQERHNQRAETLSGGEQQMLAIARALMARPRLLLMDEPSLGLAPLMVERLVEAITDINRDGISVLLVEQNAGLAFSLTEQTYLLEVGKIVMEGKTKDLMNDEYVIKAFLGG
ncbi:MAG: braG [Chloroflexi bacterium]|nr:braG [Chloroflexota bacterium]